MALPLFAPAALAAWRLALVSLKGFASQWEGGVTAVEVHLNGLPLHGFSDVRAVTLEGKGYPMFTPQRTLSAVVPELTSGAPVHPS